MSAVLVTEKQEQFVVFRLAGECYGIPILLVQEIIRSCEITKVPRTVAHVRGVVNLRGKIVPVIDLRCRLGIPAVDETPASRIIVVELETSVVGLIVDSVSEVKTLLSDQIEEPSELVSKLDSEIIRGVGKLKDILIIILDIAKVIAYEDSLVLNP